ncbi:hypothetical protein [uncultured Kordia sp.]|uniref:hypothetical protein n=1 Tax=uncultured Kordia sp. TaxID=507699 RepID=UPI00262B8EAC|nr:hypothetical protein [uncultured Kordia sp.]
MEIKLSKTIKITTLFFLMVFTSNAADLVVRDGGAGGAYATITSAIAAASDGDRIIIRPKSSNLPYIESVSVNKSLTFVTEIHGVRYAVLGNFNIEAAAGRIVTVHDLELEGTNNVTMSSDVTGNDRMQINILNSRVNNGFGDINFQKNSVTVNVVGCSFRSLRMVHGKAIANDCEKIIVGPDNGTVLANDDIYIIANKIFTSDLNVDPVEIFQPQYAFHVLNNYIKSLSGSNYVLITSAKENTTNFINNNYVEGTTSQRIRIDGSGTGTGTHNIVINNNILSAIDVNNSDAFVVATYNVTTNTAFSFSSVDIQSNNTTNVNFTTSPTADILAVGDNINAGDPNSIYTDIDLTRNDIGRAGGSFSWNNYWPLQDQQPYVFFLNTPRIIFNGITTFDANGSGTTN